MPAKSSVAHRPVSEEGDESWDGEAFAVSTTVLVLLDSAQNMYKTSPGSGDRVRRNPHPKAAEHP